MFREKLREKCIIGMVHCLPLPGTLNYGGSMEEVIEQAVQDAITLEKGGATAIMVENQNDVPMSQTLSTEQLAALAAVSARVVEMVSIPVGISSAFCDWQADIAIAVAVGAQFVRVPVFVDTVVTATGTISPCCTEIVRYRKAMGADHICLLCDVQVKHSYMAYEGISVEDSAKMAVQNGADAVIVTGTTTGEQTPIEMIKSVKRHVDVPVLAGSGFSADNASEQLEYINGAIVGSALKKDKVLTNPVKLELVENLMNKVNG